MDIAVATVAEESRRSLEVRNHRNRKAGVSCKRLLEAQICRDALDVAGVELLELPVARAPAIDARREPAHAMHIKVQPDEIVSLPRLFRWPPYFLYFPRFPFSQDKIPTPFRCTI